MIKKLLVLAVMLCSLAFVGSEPASAGSWCTCAATSCTSCSGQCNPDPGTTTAEVMAAAQACCEGAIQAYKDAGPAMACGPGGVSQ
jgi:hypothetical protein